MISSRLLETIDLYNEFLGEELEFLERELEPRIRDESRYGMVQAVVGLRRVGKTAMLQRILKTSPSKAFYFSFDEPGNARTDILDQVIKYALDQGKKWIGLDEVQKVNGWAGVLKKYYDTRKARFLVSGSSSLEITKGKESLAGRILDYNLFPLSFREYVNFSGNNNITEYMKTGFPEMVLSKIPANRYIPSIVGKIVEEDIPTRYQIQKPEILSDLVELLAERNCELVDYRDLAQILEISKDTAKTYTWYLEKSYLLEIVPVYARRLGSSKRRIKKVFFTFPSIPNVYFPQGIGKLVENVVYMHLRINGPVYFWRERDKEVDFVVPSGRRILPIEVKYQSGITRSDFRGLLAFMDKFKVKTGLLISKDTYDKAKFDKKEITVIPLTRFLENKEKVL